MGLPSVGTGTWRLFYNSAPSFSVAGYADGVYDVFITHSGSGVIGTSTAVWTNGTTRAGALEDTTGATRTTFSGLPLVQAGDENDVYIGTIYVLGGEVTNLPGDRGIWNLFNQRQYLDRQEEPDISWNFASNTPRAVNGNTTVAGGWRHQWVCGFRGGQGIHAYARVLAQATVTTTALYTIGFVKDGTGSPVGADNGEQDWFNPQNETENTVTATYTENDPTIGLHFIQATEVITGTPGSGINCFPRPSSVQIGGMVTRGWW